jgi:hypothetical protein
VRLIEVPELPAGALRTYSESEPLPEGTGTVVGTAGDLRVGRGPSTLAIYRGGLRYVLRLDRPFRAALANACHVVFVAIDSGAATELVRWDIDRAFLEPLAAVPGTFTHVSASPDGSRVALFDGHRIVACDGATGGSGWSRTIDRPGRIDHVAFDGETVSFYASWFDPDEPDYTFTATRVRAVGEIEKLGITNENGAAPPWFERADASVGNAMYSAVGLLAVSPDGTRAATPVRAWDLPGGAYVSLRGLESWVSLSFSRREVQYEAAAIAYDDGGELWRISTAIGERPLLERCHAHRTPAIELPAIRLCALLAGDAIGVVIADDREVKLGRMTNGVITFDTIWTGHARALACARGVIAIDAGDAVLAFDASGRLLASLPTVGALRAVAPGGTAVACIADGRLAIDRTLRGDGATGPVAFSRDGALVANATSYGFTVLDSATGEVRTRRGDLVSHVADLAFATDTLYTLGRDGTLTEWDPRR